MTLPHHGKFKYATQPPGPSLKGWATSVPKMVKWAYLGRPLTDLAEIKNPGFKFHPGHFEPGWAGLGPKWKFTDFQNSTSYGSVEVSGAQISNIFEIGSLEPENGTKTCPKMAYFVPRAKILNFGPIKLCLMANMGFLGSGNSFLTIKITFENVLYLYRVYLGCIVGVSVVIPILNQSSSALWVRWGSHGRGIHFWQLK